MTENNNVKNLLGASIEKIREIVDTDTVIGNPMVVGEDLTIIPVSKVSYGFASGGSDLPSKNNTPLFGGGGGAGINITPIAFLIVSGGNVRMMPVSAKPGSADKFVSMMPEMLDKMNDLFHPKKDDQQATQQ